MLGCQLVLNKLENEFYDKLIDENLETNYYMTIGYILGNYKLIEKFVFLLKRKLSIIINIQ